jgi:hypothetical protein
MEYRGFRETTKEKFQEQGKADAIEQRRDVYLVLPSDDVSVKLRFGTYLELKIRSNRKQNGEEEWSKLSLGKCGESREEIEQKLLEAPNEHCTAVLKMLRNEQKLHMISVDKLRKKTFLFEHVVFKILFDSEHFFYESFCVENRLANGKIKQEIALCPLVGSYNAFLRDFLKKK